MDYDDKKNRIARWYFGGIAAAGAATVTHPFDTLKVLLQTQQQKTAMTAMLKRTIQTEGFLKLYNGLSAAILRQFTYSMTRFAIYETLKQRRNELSDQKLTFANRVWMAAVSGACGGFVGTPADMVNVRMQNDIKLPKEKRRNYKHALQGLYTVATKEGYTKVFKGATIGTSRAVLMTIGQISIYDQAKAVLIDSGYFEDNLTTLFAASLMAAGVTTLLTQPLDVLKTRWVTDKTGQYHGLGHLVLETTKEGPQTFFRGFCPAFLRLGPLTILTFLFFENLRMNFGIVPHNHPAHSTY